MKVPGGWRSRSAWIALFAAALVVYLIALGNARITHAESKDAEASREPRF